MGFIRDIIFAKLIGTSFVGDAFLISFKIPNIFRNLIAEGATSAAVVPVLSEYLENKKKQEFWEFVNIVITTALIILSAITIIGIIFTPIILRIIVPGFLSNSEKYFLAIKLTRIMFPYLVFIGMTAYLIGILHTFKLFIVPAFSPCLLNISIIISSFFVAYSSTNPAVILAIGVLIGGLLQLLVQLIPLKKIGMKYNIPHTLKHPGIIKINNLMIPRIVGSGVYHINVLVDSLCASFVSVVGEGGISAIYFANRIINLPIGVVATALSTVLLPSLASSYTKSNYDYIYDTVNFALKKIFFIMVPISIIIYFLSTPLIRIIFQRGAFNAYSTHITSLTLSFYSIGLFAFGANKILITSFYSLQDTKTPVKIAFICLIINASLNFILMYPLKIGGIALASSIAGMVNFVLLYIFLKKKIRLLKD